MPVVPLVTIPPPPPVWRHEYPSSGPGHYSNQEKEEPSDRKKMSAGRGACSLRPRWGLGDPAALSKDTLVEATIVALRLTTPMPSGNLHHLFFNVLTYEDAIQLRCRDKKNKITTHKVDGVTRDLVVEYASRHHDSPAPYFATRINLPTASVLRELPSTARLL